mgnify:FL=1|tara:strand:+ start:35 stop:253 length:219 start_codon:yes stop_codon:yes gene_type:complete
MINPMDDLRGTFVIKNEGKLLEFDRCGDLPDEFDHLIKFAPTAPEPPHTVNDHVEMSKYTQYLQELVSRERK